MQALEGPDWLGKQEYSPAPSGIWAQDLLITRRVLYRCTTTAELGRIRFKGFVSIKKIILQQMVYSISGLDKHETKVGPGWHNRSASLKLPGLIPGLNQWRVL